MDQFYAATVIVIKKVQLDSNIIEYKSLDSNISAGVYNLTLRQLNDAAFTDHSSMEILPPAAPDVWQQDNGKF